MRNLSDSLKSIAINGTLSLEKALAIARQYEELQETSRSLLKQANMNVGMDLGEAITAHVAQIEGKHFNSLDYNYESMPTNQRI